VKTTSKDKKKNFVIANTHLLMYKSCTLELLKRLMILVPQSSMHHPLFWSQIIAVVVPCVVHICVV